MTNQLALILGALILLGLGTDILLLGGENFIFLAKKMMELTEYIAFWR